MFITYKISPAMRQGRNENMSIKNRYALQKADGKATTIHKYVGMIPGKGLHIFKMPLI